MGAVRGGLRLLGADVRRGGWPMSKSPSGDICRNRHGGASTSVGAFISTPGSVRAKQRGLVLDYVVERSPSPGATTEEVSVGLGIAYTAASARMSELKMQGILIDSGRRRKTSHGKPAAALVWSQEEADGQQGLFRERLRGEGE